MLSVIWLIVYNNVNHGPSEFNPMIDNNLLNDTLTLSYQGCPDVGDICDLYDDVSSYKSYQGDTSKPNDTSLNSLNIVTETIGDELKELRLINKNRIIIGHLNINSVRNKFEELKLITAKNLDIILISETKLDASFPSKQFLIDGFSPPYRMDRTNKGGGLICFIKENIPSKGYTDNIYQRRDVY